MRENAILAQAFADVFRQREHGLMNRTVVELTMLDASAGEPRIDLIGIQ